MIFCRFMQEIVSNIVAWYLKNARDLPWRNTRNPYSVWLSEVLLQQTRVNQGLPYYEKFIVHFPTIHHLAQASEDEVLKTWQGLGYYSRARNLHKTARIVAESLQGNFPQTPEGLQKLPGLGPYTAAAIASIAFNYPEPVLDGNVARVVSRMLDIHEAVDLPSVKKGMIEWLRGQIAYAEPGTFNQAWMELGALVCLPARPLCDSCPIASWCMARQRGTAEELPVKKAKAKVRERWFHYLHLENENAIWLVQRHAGDIWEGLWEFPMYEAASEKEVPSDWLPKLVADPQQVEISLQRRFTHLLTHQRIHANFWKLSTRPENLRLQQPIFEFPLVQEELPALHRLMDKYLKAN
jgi:A/G-specific adenine glycosylase